jgi:DNA primase
MASQEISRLKAANPIEDVAREWYGITFDPKGRGRCPFHERHNNGDQNPSLHLDRNHGRLRCQSQNCFGGPVDVIGLVMKLDTVGFKAACQKLTQRSG